MRTHFANHSSFMKTLNQSAEFANPAAANVLVQPLGPNVDIYAPLHAKLRASARVSSDGGFCSACASRPQDSLYSLLRKRAKLQHDLQRMVAVCGHCAGCRELADECQASDCSAYYSRARTRGQWERVADLESWCAGLLGDPN